ncbi:Uncharacterised protein g7232 [Pycnogonum litorale]
MLSLLSVLTTGITVNMKVFAVTVLLCVVVLAVDCRHHDRSGPKDKCFPKPSDECLSCLQGEVNDAAFNQIVADCSTAECFSGCVIKGLKAVKRELPIEKGFMSCSSCRPK